MPRSLFTLYIALYKLIYNSVVGTSVMGWSPHKYPGTGVTTQLTCNEGVDQTCPLSNSLFVSIGIPSQHHSLSDWEMISNLQKVNNPLQDSVSAILLFVRDLLTIVTSLEMIAGM